MGRRKPIVCQFISRASVVTLVGMLPLSTGCSALMAVALSGSNIKYVPCTKCAIEPVASAQVVEGQAGQIQQIAEQMHLPHNSEYDRALLGFKLRRELTSQLGSNDYRLIGEIAAAGSAMTSMSDLKKQMAKRVAKEGGDVLLITDNDLAEQPYAYSTPGYATTSVYGNTVQSNYYPGRTYAGTMQYPLAKGVAMKYSPGWDALIQKLLAQDQATFMEVHKKVAAMESQETGYAALEQRMREIINALPTPTVVAASSLSSTAPTLATQPAGLGPIATAARSVVTIRAESSLGSGVCVNTPRTILTAAHVVDGKNTISIETAEGQQASAVVLKSDDESDLAVLLVNRTIGLQPLDLRDTEPSIGEECYALGAPRGLTGTVTKGIVSAVRAGKLAQWIQTDAAINPGNSGGPLIDGEGRVIGVCDWKLSGGGTEGLGFAVGAESIRKILKP